MEDETVRCDVRGKEVGGVVVGLYCIGCCCWYCLISMNGWEHLRWWLERDVVDRRGAGQRGEKWERCVWKKMSDDFRQKKTTAKRTTLIIINFTLSLNAQINPPTHPHSIPNSPFSLHNWYQEHVIPLPTWAPPQPHPIITTNAPSNAKSYPPITSLQIPTQHSEKSPYRWWLRQSWRGNETVEVIQDYGLRTPSSHNLRTPKLIFPWQLQLGMDNVFVIYKS